MSDIMNKSAVSDGWIVFCHLFYLVLTSTVWGCHGGEDCYGARYYKPKTKGRMLGQQWTHISHHNSQYHISPVLNCWCRRTFLMCRGHQGNRRHGKAEITMLLFSWTPDFFLLKVNRNHMLGNSHGLLHFICMTT